MVVTSLNWPHELPIKPISLLFNILLILNSWSNWTPHMHHSPCLSINRHFCQHWVLSNWKWSAYRHCWRGQSQSKKSYKQTDTTDWKRHDSSTQEQSVHDHKSSGTSYRKKLGFWVFLFLKNLNWETWGNSRLRARDEVDRVEPSWVEYTGTHPNIKLWGSRNYE